MTLQQALSSGMIQEDDLARWAEWKKTTVEAIRKAEFWLILRGKLSLLSLAIGLLFAVGGILLTYLKEDARWFIVGGFSLPVCAVLAIFLVIPIDNLSSSFFTDIDNWTKELDDSGTLDPKKRVRLRDLRSRTLTRLGRLLKLIEGCESKVDDRELGWDDRCASAIERLAHKTDRDRLSDLSSRFGPLNPRA